jgi:hypothetical protein
MQIGKKDIENLIQYLGLERETVIPLYLAHSFLRLSSLVVGGMQERRNPAS